VPALPAHRAAMVATERTGEKHTNRQGGEKGGVRVRGHVYRGDLQRCSRQQRLPPTVGASHSACRGTNAGKRRAAHALGAKREQPKWPLWSRGKTRRQSQGWRRAGGEGVPAAQAGAKRDRVTRRKAERQRDCDGAAQVENRTLRAGCHAGHVTRLGNRLRSIEVKNANRSELIRIVKWHDNETSTRDQESYK